MSSMHRIGTLSELPRQDTRAIRDLYPEEAKEHSGRMRVQAIEELLDQYEGIRTLGDPMVGTGSTCIGAAKHGIQVLGCEVDKRFADVAKMVAKRAKCKAKIFRADARKVKFNKNPKLDIILTSPPFPNAHTQGDSEMQKSMREQRSTYAGNEFAMNDEWGCGTRPKKDVWVDMLADILDHWVTWVYEGGFVFVHVKDFVRKGEVVDVGEWVARAMEMIEITVLGDYGIPLGYTSGFQEWKKYHQRSVKRWYKGNLSCKLECGHKKTYDKVPLKLPKRAVCVDCGEKPGHVEVREERIIVGQWPGLA